MHALASGWVLLFAAALVVLWRKLGKPVGLPSGSIIWLLTGALVLVAPIHLLQDFILDLAELPTSAQLGSDKSLLATVILSPIEQMALVLLIWPLHRAQRLLSPQAAIAVAIMAAGGYALFDGAWLVFTGNEWTVTLRALIHCAYVVASCILWAVAASHDQRHRTHWFAAAWVLAIVVEGVGNYLALSQAIGFIILAVPLLVVIGAGAISVLRRDRVQHGDPQRPSRTTAHSLEVRSLGERLSRAGLLPERPTLHQIRVAWKHQNRPALLHWIAAGAIISLGALMVFAALAVWGALWMGVDLGRLDQGELSATGPLLLLGAVVLLAFPFAGFLVAAASAADSVFEPGVGALVAIVIVVASLSVYSPVLVVFALAVAPFAFGLACVGAWFGLERSQ